MGVNENPVRKEFKKLGKMSWLHLYALRFKTVQRRVLLRHSQETGKY